MCKFSSKSGGVPFQISFFLGDLTRNDPCVVFHFNVHNCMDAITVLTEYDKDNCFELLLINILHYEGGVLSSDWLACRTQSYHWLNETHLLA